MATNGRIVRLTDRDYELLRDIYEFYFMDFHAARLRFWTKANTESERRLFNWRMQALSQANYIAQVPFFSERRAQLRGSANYAYTLTSTGVQVLSDWMGMELEWDTSRKDRKNIYIQHHVNVLYYTYLYTHWIVSGKAEYFGEQSARFQIENKDQILKDFVKPDAVLLIKEEQVRIPWMIEYERNSRASKSTILTKLNNHSQYALRQYYKRHEILKEYDIEEPPILLFYCENLKVAQRRIDLIAQEHLSFYDPKKGGRNGYVEVLLGIQEAIEKDPYGKSYLRPSGEKVKLQQINQMQLVAKAIAETSIPGFPKEMEYTWHPSYIASRRILLDGILEFQYGGVWGALMVRYFPEDSSEEQIKRELRGWIGWKEENKISEHPVLNRSKEEYRPVLLFVVNTTEQEKQLTAMLTQLQFEERFEWTFAISRHDLVCREPYGDHWLSIDGERGPLFE